MMKNITADEMRKLATKDNDEIGNILIKIKEQSEGGNTALYIPDCSIKDTTRMELKKRGFKIEFGGRYNEINTLISWD